MVSFHGSGFESVLAKCCKIVGHFKRSPSNTLELSEQQIACGQKQDSLVQDVTTKWNLSLEMVKRIQQNKSSQCFHVDFTGACQTVKAGGTT